MAHSRYTPPLRATSVAGNGSLPQGGEAAQAPHGGVFGADAGGGNGE